MEEFLAQLKKIKKGVDFEEENRKYLEKEGKIIT